MSMFLSAYPPHVPRRSEKGPTFARLIASEVKEQKYHLKGNKRVKGVKMRFFRKIGTIWAFESYKRLGNVVLKSEINTNKYLMASNFRGY